MKCYASPYEGQQDYLFFSYCHDDAAKVFPIIERLALEGFRVWFDDGIHPGEEWPEVIANHLTGAKACVCLVGSPETFCSMVENNVEQRRYSGLKDRIRELA